MNNVFIVKLPLPSSSIEAWRISELCYLHDHQVIGGGDLIYIKKIRSLIVSKLISGEQPNFSGEGCCSEFRNSIQYQYERLEQIIKI